MAYLSASTKRGESDLLTLSLLAHTLRHQKVDGLRLLSGLLQSSSMDLLEVSVCRSVSTSTPEPTPAVRPESLAIN